MQEIGAGARRQHRIKHDVLRLVTLQTGGDRAGNRDVAEHADFHRRDPEIGKHRIHLRADKFRRYVVNGRDALGVLRRQRGDHRGAVNVERGEALDISLDTGAASGIGTGDAEGDWHRHHPPRLASAASTTWRNAREAAAGSGASDSAEITATPAAPAAITGPALAASIPAMPQTGNCGARRCRASITRANPSGPIGALFCFFDSVTYTPP